MPTSHATVQTEDGVCAVTLHTPAEQGSWPAVIFYPDAGGVREVFVAMADRLAGLGYAVLLPDVYYRAGGYAPFDVATAFDDPAERERLFTLMQSLTAERVVSDANAFLAFLADRPEVSGDRVGTTGYCMGGRISLIVAGNRPDRIAAAASFHGGFLAAENDDSFPLDQQERLEQALTAAGVAHSIEVYPAGHGFAVPDNPTYDTAAFERHWTALADLYAKSLAG
ncbi:dienelactone hydrolase family protein [Streptomyces varsoviensis]|uniref:Dienelactone hydrolase family protein n=1 Tax=Streptomyces varsoviensis TaxID=67373 RepID=A0ABR5IWY2_9ACTN|nr:dienelactone hydrolase family protein [Streptomyces varsoviensis]